MKQKTLASLNGIMMTRKSKEELEAIFEKSGIDFAHPGFYNTPEFKAVEKKAPEFIMAYAEYIESHHFEDEYVQRARACVAEVASFMFAELLRDGRRGACIDASGVTQKILEREGIWSYLVCGGARIKFPDSSHIPDSFFRPIVHPDNPAKTGHAWLCVPPFKVVDITLPVQAYPPRALQYFDGMVIAEQFSSYEPSAGDLYENALVELVIRQSGKSPTLGDLATPVRRFMDTFPSFGVEYQQLRLKYIPTNTNALDGEIEELRNLRLSGIYPAELHNKLLRARELARSQ